MTDRLDPKDPAAFARWLAALRVAVDDADDVARDLLRPPRKRSLGPRLHRSLYADAARSVRTLLAYAEPFPPDSEQGEPARARRAGARRRRRPR